MMRVEFDTRRVFSSLTTAQQALDEWVAYYNDQRPHQTLGTGQPPAGRPVDLTVLAPDRCGEDWVARKVGPKGVVCASWQQVSVGKRNAGQLASSGEVRKKNAART
jgi:Integrase core domain